MEKSILVTGAAGRVGAIGRTVTDLLLKQGKPVRAMVRKEDDRAQSLRDMGAEVVVGDLLDLDSTHKAIAGVDTMYFGMSISDDYLAAAVNVAAVAKHHGVKALVNMSQMTVSQMSIAESTASPQHKLHWLAERVLNWSGLPVVHVRPTVLLDGFFQIFTAESVRQSNQILLPLGEGRTSPVAVEEVARVLSTILVNPQPHIGKIYHLTGPQSEDMHFYARESSEARGRTITLSRHSGRALAEEAARAQTADSPGESPRYDGRSASRGKLRSAVGRCVYDHGQAAAEGSGVHQEECGCIHPLGKCSLSAFGLLRQLLHSRSPNRDLPGVERELPLNWAPSSYIGRREARREQHIVEPSPPFFQGSGLVTNRH